MRLIAEDVHKTFGPVTALAGLDLTIPDGSTFGLLGINGAGKTTLFELFVGLETPDSGRIRLGDRLVADTDHHIRQRVGYLPERIGFPDGLTGREVLDFHARMRGLDQAGDTGEILETVGLSRADTHRRVDGYSNGMRRRLGLATAILPDPDVLILDEPTSGLDPRGLEQFHRIVRRARDRTGATVVLASHVLSEVDRICDHVAIIDDGRTVVSGPVDELTGDDSVTVGLPESPVGTDQLQKLVGDTGTVAKTPDGVAVDTSPAALPRLVEALEEIVDVDALDIHQRRLEAVFHRQFDHPRPEPAAPTAGGDRDD